MSTINGRHRQSSTTRRYLGRVAIAGVALGAPLILAAAPAQAASGNDWDAVAQCESTGNWSINTGNGSSGGLQFSPSTWKAYGGTGGAQAASKAEQIRVAENVLAGQGKGAWPVCGRNLGSGTTSASPVQQKSAPASQAAPKATAPKQATPQPQAAPKATEAPATVTSANANVVSPPKAGANYTVVAGDTLSTIAQTHNVQGGYLALFEKNTDVVENVDMIFPGETLTL